MFSRHRNNNLDVMFARMLPTMILLLDSAQLETAEEAVANVPKVMGALGFDYEPSYEPDPAQWVGVNGNGQDTMQVLYRPIVEAKQLMTRERLSEQMLRRIESETFTRVRTCLADTQRSASMVAAKGRYAEARAVRVLNPPSCARCVILAGTTNIGVRHPNCDCTLMWSADLPENAFANPYDYLNSLSDDELARVLGSKANARAYLDGADIYQLVNAYRRKGAVSKAQFYDRRIKYTTEGTTKHGAAARRMIDAGYANGFIRDRKRMRLDRPRLMPETIYEICDKSGKDPKQMLKAYGWIL